MSAEEELMKMRLLIDGDGTGEDRRLNLLLKQMMRWASTDYPATAAAAAAVKDSSKGTTSDMENDYERILTQLTQCEWTVQKNSLVERMNKEELKNYEALVSQIEEGITVARKEISETKAELAVARKLRRNKLEYDALAKEICKIPDRATSESKLAAVQAELDNLRRTELILDEKLEERKKQFHVLVHSIHRLQALLDQESEEDQNFLGGGGRNGNSTRHSSDLNTSNVSSTPDRDDLVDLMDEN